MIPVESCMKCQRHRLRSRDCAAGILANNFNVGECVSSIDEKEQHSTATQKYDISKDRLTMSAMLQSLFADKLVHDDREPIAILGQYAVFAPDFRLWMQLFVFLLMQQALQVLAAIVVYTFIVKQRGTIGAYLIGWGFVFPIFWLLPYYLLEFLDIQSKVIKMAAATPAFIVCFRCIEAMYDTSPAVVENSLSSYITYYTTLLHFDWDPKTGSRRKLTRSEFTMNLLQLILYLLLLSIVLSFELAYDFQPFQSRVQLENFHFTFDLLSFGHLANAYCLAVTVYLTLAFGFGLTAFGEQAKGYYTKPIFFNPLFTSLSPSDFWGRKWNLMIHRILKHGAFLPARRVVGTKLAVLWTFIVSGLLHDYTWSIIFYQHEHTRNADGKCLDCFAPTAAKLTAFFAWNGVVMLLERKLESHFKMITKYLPVPLISSLVVMTALPVSHWYSGDWARGGYFKDLSIGLWQIRKIA